MVAFPLVQIWFSVFLPGGLWEYALSDVAGGGRSDVPAPDRQPVLDIPAPLALGIYGNIRTRMGGTIQFRFLQHHAHLLSPGPGDDGAVQAAKLVRLLPYGHHDAVDMSASPQEKQGFNKRFLTSPYLLSRFGYYVLNTPQDLICGVFNTLIS